MVKDLDESAAFYTEALRLREIPNPMGGTDIRWFDIGGDRRIRMQAGDFGATRVHKGTHIAPTALNFDETPGYLRSRNAAFSDFEGTPGAVNVRPDGMPAIFLQDPNGYWIEINDFG